MKKTLITIVATVLLCCCLIGTTYAWLVDKTESIKNTFTYGNIDIDLVESANLDLKMIPGKTIAKDPKVIVAANSEACWLFIKVEKSANFDTFMTYAMSDGWTVLNAVNAPGVFYRKVASSDADQEIAVLMGNTVTVQNTVTKDMVDAIANGTATAPTLTFTAYAVQQEGVSSAEAAWSVATTGNLPVAP